MLRHIHCFWLPVLLAAWSAAASSAVGATLEVGHATGRPSEVVEIAVRLRGVRGDEAAALEADLLLDPRIAAIGIDANRRPDCRVNAALGKPASGFGFDPVVCKPGATQCERIHAVIIAIDNSFPLPDDSLLFHCRIRIRSDAPSGSYPIQARNALIANVDGEDNVAGVSAGSITVLAAPPTTANGNSSGSCAITKRAAAPDLFNLVLAALGLVIRGARQKALATAQQHSAEERER